MKDKVKLIKELSKMDIRVFFANSGAEANEGAIKIARKYGETMFEKKKYKVITIKNSFHGRTITTLKATAQDRFHDYYGPYPEGFFYAATIDEAMEMMDDETCAVMLEPIQAEGGVYAFEKDSLDLIWSEGAIYNIGFERGLKEWRNYLKPGGYLAVSESVWFTDQRPAEIHDFWMSAYTEIDTVPNKVAQIQKAGYIPVATFILPENCWIEHYVAPQAKAEEIFRRKHAGSRIVEELITSNHHEAELYSKYKAYYGYAFFICKKGFSLRR